MASAVGDGRQERRVAVPSACVYFTQQPCPWPVPRTGDTETAGKVLIPHRWHSRVGTGGKAKLWASEEGPGVLLDTCVLARVMPGPWWRIHTHE